MWLPSGQDCSDCCGEKRGGGMSDSPGSRGGGGLEHLLTGGQAGVFQRSGSQGRGGCR